MVGVDDLRGDSQPWQLCDPVSPDSHEHGNHSRATGRQLGKHLSAVPEQALPAAQRSKAGTTAGSWHHCQQLALPRWVTGR